MVGHSGKLDATIKAVNTIDIQLGRIFQAFPDSYIIITADHGNAEGMVDPETGHLDTEHSVNPVPLIIAHPDLVLRKPLPDMNNPSAILADIAPTILHLLKIDPPETMTGYNLLSTFSLK